MQKVVRLPNIDNIQERACEWIAKMDRGSMSETEKKALAEWLNIDSSHRKVLMEMAGLLDDMTVLSQLSEIIPLDTLSISTVSNQKENTGLGKYLRLKPVYAFCFVIIVVFTGILSGIILLESGTDQVLRAQTSVGELKTITLPDSTKVTLNTYSQIDLEFSQQQRRVILIRGEAHFVVRSDEDRPFFVVVGDKIVEAVGTAFNVKTRGKQIEVTVTEGVVKITTAIKTDNNPETSQLINTESSIAQSVINVSAGHSAIVTNDVESIESLDPISIEKKLAWQKGMIVFEGETLEQVVEEISRYTTKTFIISDEEARHIRVGGYFEIGDINKMLDVLEHGFNISATTTPIGTIYLSRLTPESDKTIR